MLLAQHPSSGVSLKYSTRHDCKLEQMAKSSLGWKSNLASAIYCSILRPANGILSPSFKNHNEPLVTKLMPEKRQQCQSCSSSSLKMIIITFFSRCQTTGRLHPPWSGGPRVSGAAVWVSWPLTHRRRSLHNTPLLYCATVVENQRKSRIWKVFEREAKLNTKISSAFYLQNMGASLGENQNERRENWDFSSDFQT